MPDASQSDPPPLSVAITGASGLVGSALDSLLTAAGHRVVRLGRRKAITDNEASWDPTSGVVDLDRLEGLDGFVHLAGENVGDGRWSEAKKRKIRDSRIEGTHRLIASLTRLERPPRTFLCASAVGFYGDQADQELSEDSAAGSGFLAAVCDDWEEASRRAAEFGARVVHARFGVVLSPRGGALARMLLPFRLGAGGNLGNGRQFMSWISIGDATGALLHLLGDDQAGPVNVTAPHPVRNREFTRVLGKVLRRPTLVPIPAFAARLAFGEMADEMLLSSARALPIRLLADGFEFAHPDLEGALRHLLRRS